MLDLSNGTDTESHAARLSETSTLAGSEVVSPPRALRVKAELG
jgi:hypothetical protein